MSAGDDDAGNKPYRGPSRAAPYALSRLSAPVSLVDAPREIEQADAWIASTTSAQLSVIAEQIRALRAQAEAVVTHARENAELHRAEARFQRVPGKVYHLYQRPDGTRYWSMLAPADWNGTPPHAFVGSYRLEADRSFTPVERIAERDAAQKDLADWVKTKLLP